MATRKGFVKKTPISEYANVRRAGLIAIALRKGDQLAWVASCSDKDRILLATKKGKGIVFKATDARPMGRQTQGVTGIRLGKGDQVIGMGIVQPRTQVLSVTEHGFGKRTDVEEFPTHGRGGQGVILAALTTKTGDVSAIQMVDERAPDEVRCRVLRLAQREPNRRERRRRDAGQQRAEPFEGVRAQAGEQGIHKHLERAMRPARGSCADCANAYRVARNASRAHRRTSQGSLAESQGAAFVGRFTSTRRWNDLGRVSAW